MSPTRRLLPAALLLACAAWITFPSGPTGSDARAEALAWGTPGRSQPGSFDHPRCVAVAPNGSVWVLDLTGRIQRFTPAGVRLGEVRMPTVEVGRPQGMTCDPLGRLVVADTHYHRILTIDPATGAVVRAFGEEGREEGRLFWPCAVAVDADGTIYSAEYGGHDRIQVWSPEGRRIGGWGAFGTEPGRFMRPAGLALAPAGLWVADAANHRIQLFSRDGRLLACRGGEGAEPGRFRYPYGIALDAAGRIHTIEYGGWRLQRFAEDGAALAWRGPVDGRNLRQPWGLAVTADGTVFAADTDNDRIVRMKLR